MIRAAVYLRVSTERQDEANQEPDVLRLCAARGWEPVIYRERESGAKRRPEWDRVKERSRVGDVGAVVFWSIDRIGRNRVQAAQDLRELFRWKVTVVSVKERWLDCSPDQGPLRDLLVDVVTWFAEEERRKLRERTVAGLARARLLGKVLGRPSAIPPLAQAQLREISATFPEWTPGMLSRALKAQGFGTFKPQTLRSFLKRSRAA